MITPENPFAGKSKAELERQAAYLALAMKALEAEEEKAEKAKSAALIAHSGVSVMALTFLQAWRRPLSMPSAQTSVP